MSAYEALSAAQEAGICVTPDGDGLLLEAVHEPPQSVLDALQRHKHAILNLLQPCQLKWTPEQRAYFDRPYRCAPTSSGRPLSEANLSALECSVIEWLNRHPTPSAPGSCAWCGKTECPDAVVLPFGTERGTHAWLHSNCWPAWHAARRAAAIAALAAMGTDQPGTHQ
jgi:hypothetical protein